MDGDTGDTKWPSTRVAKGGIFNLLKVRYSRETHDFLNLLMEEQKLSIVQRDKINYILRNGQSLPASKPLKKPTTECFPGLDLMRAKNARRRTLDAIRAGGCYDREKFIPRKFEPIEQKKVRLQEKMSGLKHEFSIEKVANAPSEVENQIDPIDELLHEIQERMDWLEEMDKLGEGHKYKALIKSEIEERLRSIKRLQPN